MVNSYAGWEITLIVRYPESLTTLVCAVESPTEHLQNCVRLVFKAFIFWELQVLYSTIRADFIAKESV